MLRRRSAAMEKPKATKQRAITRTKTRVEPFPSPISPANKRVFFFFFFGRADDQVSEKELEMSE